MNGFFGVVGGGTGFGYGTITNSPIQIYTNNTEKLRLSSAGGLSLGNTYVSTDAGAGNMIIQGNVGIGTTSPGYPLTVANGGYDLLRVGLQAGYTTLSTNVQYNGFWFQNNLGVSNGTGFTNLNAGGAIQFNSDASISIRNSSAIDYARFYSSSGGLSLGIGYAGTAAPANGMIISGNVGIGTTSPSQALNVVGNGLFTGTVTASNLNQTQYSLAVPTNVDDATEFATVTNTNFSSNVELWFTVHSSGYAQSKRYIVPVQYNCTIGAWQKALPISTTGIYAGNDAEIDVKVSNQIATFRIRRTVGSTAGTASITLAIGGDTSGTTVASSSTTYTGQTVTVNYALTSLVMNTGKTGINNETPTAFLDVLGTTEQLRLGFNTSNYASFTTGSTGSLTIVPTGTNPNITLTPGGTGYTILNGNVGIGTTTPGQPLQVNGNALIADTASASSKYAQLTLYGGASDFPGLEVNGRWGVVSDGIIRMDGYGGGYTGYIKQKTDGTGTLQFIQNGNIGIAINNNGNVGIGTTNPSYALDVKASGAGVIARFNSSNATGCTLADGGTISCSSDVRLKKNIDGINYGLSALMQLKPVAFNWKTQDDSAAKTLGFIAQDVEQVIPQLVTTDAASGYKELNTIGLIPVLTKSIQEQQTEISSATDQVSLQTQNIAALQLKTDASVTTLSQLQTSIDEQLGAISKFQTSISGEFSTLKTQLTNDESKMTNYDQQFTALDSRIQALETASSQGTLTADLQTQIDTIKDQTKALMDFYTALTLGNVITKDAKGNVDLLGGKLTAGDVEAENEICIKDVCITKDELLDLLKRSGIDVAPQQGQSPKNESDSKPAGNLTEPGDQNVQNAKPAVSSTQTDKKADATQPATSDNSQPTVTDANTSVSSPVSVDEQQSTSPQP